MSIAKLIFIGISSLNILIIIATMIKKKKNISQEINAVIGWGCAILFAMQ